MPMFIINDTSNVGW